MKKAKPQVPQCNPDDVLKVMLNTPPQPHKPAATKKSKPRTKQPGK